MTKKSGDPEHVKQDVHSEAAMKIQVKITSGSDTKTVIALLDTGCTTSLVSRDILTSVMEEFTPAPVQTFRTADGAIARSQ